MREYLAVDAFFAERGFDKPTHVFDYRLFEPAYAKAANESVPLHKWYCLTDERSPANYALVNAALAVEVAYVGSTIQPRMRLNAHRRPKGLWPRWQATHPNDFQPTVAIWLAGRGDDIDLIEREMIDTLHPKFNIRRRPLCFCSFRKDAKMWLQIEKPWKRRTITGVS